MSLSLSITPGGRLHVVETDDGLAAVSEAAAAALHAAFARSSADGLLLLASHELEEPLSPALLFWRETAQLLFQAVCHLGEGALAQWAAIPPPSHEQLAQRVSDAPPMGGLEYLDVELLRRIWGELRKLVASQAAKFPGGPAAYLRTVNPLFHLLGRVTFHLAENKRDPARPFAFLATYTHRLSGQSRILHLPLAEALKTYAGAKEQAKLESLLEPVRRAAQGSPLIRELLTSRALFSPQAWTVRQAYRFLTEAPRIEEAGVVLRLPDWWSPRHPPRPQVQVRIGTRRASEIGLDELLDFDVGLSLDGQILTESERRELLAGADGLVLLRGNWVEVNRDQLQQALDHWKQLERENPDGVSFVEGMRLLAGAQLASEDVVDQQVASWSRVTEGDWLRETLARMRRPECNHDCQPGRDLRATLRPYQAEGVRWLWFLTELGLGACLADDMGLGKTVQVIDLLLQKRGHGRNGKTPPSLIVVPASLVGNWRQELSRFAPSLRAFFAHRSESSDEELARVQKNPRGELDSFDVVLTTYGLVRRQEWIARAPWSLVILDEAQAIKNATSVQARSVKQLQANARIVLTGTPVENHLGDLWSIFDFCCPGLLGTAGQFKQFMKRLSKQPSSESFAALRRLVRPYILRRLKTDPSVIPDLPEKTEMRAECGLSKKQAALYQQVVEDVSQRLQQVEGMARRGLVLSLLMQLKQICNHPAQYLGSAVFHEEESGKFERLRLLCEPIAERQEKVLVFTQFQSLTSPLADFLTTLFGRPGLVLHGGTPVRKRGELVREFQSDGGPPFFVISLKVGGTGLNLTAATHVVHFDRWWNPAVENQATDRAFRIGQKRNVMVHKFVCRGTVEERIDAMILAKQDLADQVLHQEAEARLTEMNDEELLRFVRLDIHRANPDP